MLTITQFAKQKNWSRTYVWMLIQEKRIPGAVKVGGVGNKGVWLLPDDAKVIKK